MQDPSTDALAAAECLSLLLAGLLYTVISTTALLSTMNARAGAVGETSLVEPLTALALPVPFTPPAGAGKNAEHNVLAVQQSVFLVASDRKSVV